jgi:DNA (cytosine-5)-methyltransferase 1
MTLTVGSLFSGVGGLELGLERAGMKTLWQVERDPYARATLQKNFPGIPCYDDVCAVSAATLVRPDVLCGGFPCQPHSIAGLKRASADERDLWGEFARLVGELGPRWVLAENVPGLLTSEGGRFFGRILADLAALGFDAEWTVRGARHVGAPHRRDRLFILAYPKGTGCEAWRGDGLRTLAGSGQGLAARAGGAALAEPSGVGRGEGRPQPAGQQGGLGAPSGRDPLDSGLAAWWAVEPGVGRVADGVPNRVDRLKCLGNAVVPEVAEEIGRLIVAAHERLEGTS